MHDGQLRWTAQNNQITTGDCTGAMFWAGIRRVVYGAPTPDIEAALGGGSLPPRCADVLAACRPAVVVEGTLLQDEAVSALRGSPA